MQPTESVGQIQHFLHFSRSFWLGLPQIYTVVMRMRISLLIWSDRSRVFAAFGLPKNSRSGANRNQLIKTCNGLITFASNHDPRKARLQNLPSTLQMARASAWACRSDSLIELYRECAKCGHQLNTIGIIWDVRHIYREI